MRISVLTPSIRPEGLKIVQESLAKQTLQDFEWLTEISVPERGYDLNRAYNRMLKRAKGELVVSYQDYIAIPETALEQVWKSYENNPGYFFTMPVGKINGDDIKWDWRIYKDGDCNFMDWEIDFGAAPLKYLKEIGGFDEELDYNTWTFDGVNVGLRAEMAGYKFKCLPNIKGIAKDHDKFIEHPFRHKMYNPDFHNARLDEIRQGLKIEYL